MKVDVYQTNKRDTYLFLPQGAPFSSVPETIRDAIGPLQFYNTMDFEPDAVGAKHSEIEAELKERGYSIHRARFEIMEPKEGWVRWVRSKKP